MRGGPIGLVMLLADKTFKEAKKLVEGSDVDLDVDDKEANKLLLIEFDKYDFHFSGLKSRKLMREELKPIRVPRFFAPLTKESSGEGWKYLIDRGLTAEDILASKVMVATLNSPWDVAEAVGKSLNVKGRKKITNLVFDFLKKKTPLQQDQIISALNEFDLDKRFAIPLEEALVALKYRNRAVFPVINHGKVYGWVARDFTGKSSLKVMNSQGPFKFTTVWNFDAVKNSSQIVICEGIISALKCGKDTAIATLGKMITDEQIGLLKTTEAKEVFICLDVDAQAEAIALKQVLLASFDAVYNISLPAIKTVKCPACGGRHDISNRDLPSMTQMPCGNEIPKAQIAYLFKKADYKDAGDYTHEEMKRFIQLAKVTDTDTFLFGAGVFKES